MRVESSKTSIFTSFVRYLPNFHFHAYCCLALPRSFLKSEDRRSLTRTPRISTCFCLLHVEHNLQRVFLSIVWYHQSSVSVVFLDVCFRQWYHVGYVCIDYQLGLHGRSTVASFVWLLPGNDLSAAAPLGPIIELLWYQYRVIQCKA